MLLPLGVLTVWARNQVLNTDRYVETVTPLASNPAIQSAIVTRVTTLIDDNVNIDELAGQVLPGRAKVLAPFIQQGANQLVQQVVTQVVHSKKFQEIWVTANRAAHTAAVHVLTGQGSKISTNENGKITIQLSSLVNEVLKQIDQHFGVNLAARIPTDKIKAQFVLIDSPDLARVQRELRWFNALSYTTAILAFVAMIGAVLVAERRRSGLRRVGFAITGSMVIMLLAYAAGREIYLNNLPSTVNQDAAKAAFDIITRFLHQAFQVFFVIGLLVLVVVWWLGHGRTSRAAHRYWDALVGKAGATGAGHDLGPVPEWVGAHQRWLQLGIGAAALVLLALWDRPTARTVIGVAVLAVILVGVVQLVAAPARAARQVDAPADT
jgi:hypothetical protein